MALAGTSRNRIVEKFQEVTRSKSEPVQDQKSLLLGGNQYGDACTGSRWGGKSASFQFALSHCRVVGRHDDRVVRFLHLRQLGGDYFAEILPAGQRHVRLRGVFGHIRRWLPRAPFRSALLWPDR